MFVPPEEPFEPRDRIGPYQILRELGRGGMGRVYLAKESALGDRYVAIKVILAADPKNADEAHARFLQEIKNLARLDHQNIVTIFTAGNDAGYPYFVMQYVPGRDLLRFVDECASLGDEERIGTILRIIAEIARAVHYAHTNGIVHRDLKPGNILITHKTDEPVILDFGIARYVGDTKLTSGAVSPGTPAFRSPEQVGTQRGGRDELIDVWALGVILYRVLTGVAPFKGRDLLSLSTQILHADPVPPRRLSPQLPFAVEQVILRCLQKDPKRRPVSALALAESLDHAMGTRDEQPRRKPLRVVALAVALVVAGAVLWYGIVGRDPTTSMSVPSREIARIAAISVMEFTEPSGTLEYGWMSDAIRDNLNSQLSKTPDCKVFSKDFIDFKAHGLIAAGRYSNMKAASMDIAQQLGVAKAVFGTFQMDDGRLSIEAHIVDLKTGVREAPDAVHGTQAEFSSLQAKLATKIMVRLGVQPHDAGSDVETSSLESYKLLLQAEGADRPAERQGRNQSGPLDSRRACVVTALGQSCARHPAQWATWRRLLAELARPGVAWADDGEPTVPTIAAPPAASTPLGRSEATADTPLVVVSPAVRDPEAQIQRALERYRLAYESKDLILLAEVYEEFTPNQVRASTRYFENAERLTVEVGDVDIALRGDRAAVSYTRKDRFTDAASGESVTLEVRLTKMLIRTEGTWKIARAQ